MEPMENQRQNVPQILCVETYDMEELYNWLRDFTTLTPLISPN